VPVVDINAMVARLALAQGPVIVSADQGRYDLDTQRVDINGPVRVDGPDGYKLTTSDVLVDLKQRQVRSDKAVQGQMRLGTFTAGRMRADLGTRTIVLDGGTRLKIVQGGVR
jgi:lipopolysaccharide export system protein LptC